MVHVAKVILERFNVAKVIGLATVQLVNLFLHSTSFRYEIFNDKIHILVSSFEVNDLGIHTGNLLLHFGDLLLSWTDVSFKLFDLVIQNKFEFLKLLSFLF